MSLSNEEFIPLIMSLELAYEEFDNDLKEVAKRSRSKKRNRKEIVEFIETWSDYDSFNVQITSHDCKVMILIFLNFLKIILYIIEYFKLINR
jgi:hypothetical protein